MPNQYTYAPHQAARTCEQCGSSFSVRLSKIEAGGGRFCSRPCQYAAKSDRVACTCQACGVPFMAPGRRVRSGLAKFCSPGCSNSALGAQRAVPAIDRVWPKLNKHGPAPECRPDLGPCWIWNGGVDGKGYGQITEDGKGLRVHRVVYEALVGPFPSGLEPDHLCRVRRCARPDHLEPVTSRENNLRGNSVAAVNARKTHCVNGHQFTPANTIHRPNGARGCRECGRRANRESQARKRAAANVA